MTTQPTPTTATLTAKRNRLETTHTELQKRQQATEAELKRVNGLEPTPEHVTAFVIAEREHRDLKATLEHTESLIAELDAELKRAGVDEARAADFETMVKLCGDIQDGRDALLKGYGELNELLQAKLEPLVQELDGREGAIRRLRALMRQHAPAHFLLGDMRSFTPEQNAAAEGLDQALKERGASLRTALDGPRFDLPEPFGLSLPGLLDVWVNNRYKYLTPETEDAQ